MAEKNTSFGSKLEIAILAINLRNGGGQTHLINLLNVFKRYPEEKYQSMCNFNLGEKLKKLKM